MRRIAVPISALAMVASGLFLVNPSPAVAGQGDLDTSFGTGGRVQVAGPYAPDDGRFTSGIIQADGKIVAAGVSTNSGKKEILVARFLTNGQPDSSFDGDGFARYPVGTDDALITSVNVTNNKMIVVAGTATSGGEAKALVARVTDTGALDTGFNDTGIVTVDVVPGASEKVTGVVSLPDRSVVAVGAVDLGATKGGWNPLALRVAADGKTNTAKTDSPYTTGDVDDRFNDIGVGPDGHATAVGTAGGQLLLAKLMAGAGTTLVHDTSFRSGFGWLTASPGHVAFSDPRIMVGGQKKPVVAAAARLPGAAATDTDTVLLRFEPNGTPDNSIGTAGISRAAAVPGTPDRPTSVVLSGASIYISKDVGTDNGVVQRFYYGGGLDQSFKVFANGSPIAGMTLLLADGKPIGIYHGPAATPYAIFRLSVTPDPVVTPPVPWAGINVPRRVRAKNFGFIHGNSANATGVEVAIRRVNKRLLRRQHVCPWVNEAGWLQRVPAHRVRRGWQCTQLWTKAQGTNPWAKSFYRLPRGRYFILVRPVTPNGPSWPTATRTVIVRR